MEKITKDIDMNIDESDFRHTRTNIGDDSDRSSVTHSGKFGSEKVS